ncbi:hypothetical protein SAMN04488132_104337 [Sediminibacterium ginsengisoli]|uniref:Uncharacterized protein n=1 Tax=Sediminibacterium ginsengisoli TaxID=413434 RepID=A0A1T4NQ15_9BACT|nr:hypothetical protein SAMN04488132_104337 [Sediminibacterium ginsengisoli]
MFHRELVAGRATGNDIMPLLVAWAQMFGRYSLSLMSPEGDSAQHASAISETPYKFQPSGRCHHLCRSGRWASSLRQRFFGLYRNVLRIISIACAALGTEPKEAPLQRLVWSFGCQLIVTILLSPSAPQRRLCKD